MINSTGNELSIMYYVCTGISWSFSRDLCPAHWDTREFRGKGLAGFGIRAKSASIVRSRRGPHEKSRNPGRVPLNFDKMTAIYQRIV